MVFSFGDVAMVSAADDEVEEKRDNKTVWFGNISVICQVLTFFSLTFQCNKTKKSETLHIQNLTVKFFTYTCIQ